MQGMNESGKLTVRCLWMTRIRFARFPANSTEKSCPVSIKVSRARNLKLTDLILKIDLSANSASFSLEYRALHVLSTH